MGPREESQNCAGRSNIITEIEVISPRIIEVDRPLYEAKSGQFCIEIKIPLGI
jgi:hypothetical protein